MDKTRSKLLTRFISSAALVASLVGVSYGFAQDPKEEVFVPEFERTPAENEVYTLYYEGKLLTARRKVEALLEDDPDSVVGNYVFGNILRQAEGSLPEAMYHLGRARELYETRFEATWPAAPGAPYQLHQEILFAIQGLAGEMEKFEYQLEILDFYDSLYRPKLTAEHAWPLMRLGRFDEAREYANEAIETGDAFSKSLGRNALCALEGEASTREPRLEACLAAFEDARERAKLDPPDVGPDLRTNVAVHAYNAAQAAIAAQRPDEAERLAIEGTKRLDFTPANPWRFLTRLYADQGRMAESVRALAEMQRWRARQPPYLRDQDRAETDVAYATVMLVAGESEAGLRAVDRAIRQPDRRGLSSSSAEQAMGAHALLRRSMMRLHAEQERESAAWLGSATGLNKRLKSRLEKMRARIDNERIVAVLADDERLEATFRMYVHGGMEPVPVWLLGDLIDILGAGVVAVTMERVRETEQEEGGFDGFEGYYDAIDAEVALAQGDEDRALELAGEAMSKLPEVEVLLRARVSAIASIAASGEERVGHLAMAMELEAGVIRRMGLELPIEIENQASGAIAEAAVEFLEKSPRFDVGEEGFLLVISGEDKALSLCLDVPQGGARLFCYEPDLSTVTKSPAQREAEKDQPPAPPVEPEGEEGEEGGPEQVELEDEEYGAVVAEMFHKRAFAMPVGVSNVDLTSLDGTSTIQQDAHRDRMQQMLDGVMEDAK